MELKKALQLQFTAEEVKLTLLLVTINGWNCVQIAFGDAYPVHNREAA